MPESPYVAKRIQEVIMGKNSSDRTAVVLALASVAFWSWAATAFKEALEFVSPWCVVTSASVISTAVLAVLLLIRRKRIHPSSVREGALLGLLNPFGYYLVLLHAYNGLPAQIAMTVNYLWPVVLVLLAVPLLGQKISIGGLAGIVLSFSGVALMALLGKETLEIRIIPLLLAFLSTVIWAVYWLLNARSRGDTNSVLLMCFLFGTVYLCIFGFLAGESFHGAREAFPWLLYTGVFEMGITYMMWNTALKKASSAATVGSLIFLTPFLALLPIAFVVGEKIALSTVMGLLLVVAGIILEKRFRKEVLK